jgi:hypothetical protein
LAAGRRFHLDGFKKLKQRLACMGRNLAGAERYYDLTWYKKASAGL